MIDRNAADATLLRNGYCPDCGTRFTEMLQQQLLAHCKFCGVAWSIEPLKYEPSQREKPNVATA